MTVGPTMAENSCRPDGVDPMMTGYRCMHVDVFSVARWLYMQAQWSRVEHG